MAKWVEFVNERSSPSGKTKAWHVFPKGDRVDLLGYVFWHSPWRKYVFSPFGGNESIYEQDCLRDIAEFIEQKTKEHKQKKSKI